MTDRNCGDCGWYLLDILRTCEDCKKGDCKWRSKKEILEFMKKERIKDPFEGAGMNPHRRRDGTYSYQLVNSWLQ